MGYSIRKFIFLEDPDTWREFRKGFLPCLTTQKTPPPPRWFSLRYSSSSPRLDVSDLKRSFIPLSPIITLRAVSKRKDGMVIRINSRVQVFYDEQGYVRTAPPTTPPTKANTDLSLSGLR